MAKTKIIFISIIFLLSAVFLNVEKAGATSCGDGGTCVERFCNSNEDWNRTNEGDGRCNQASGGMGSERCCEPTKGGNCPGACQISCSAGQQESPGSFKDCSANAISKTCCVAKTPGGTCQKLGDACGQSNNNTVCCEGLKCVESGTGTTYYYCASAEIPAPGEDDPPTPPTLTGSGVVIPEDTGLADPPGGIAQILDNLLFWLLGIIGIIALIGFVISGIQYVISTGDEDMMKTAKRNMMYCIAGIAVALAGVVIVNAINAALEANPWI